MSYTDSPSACTLISGAVCLVSFGISLLSNRRAVNKLLFSSWMALDSRFRESYCISNSCNFCFRSLFSSWSLVSSDLFAVERFESSANFERSLPTSSLNSRIAASMTLEHLVWAFKSSVSRPKTKSHVLQHLLVVHCHCHHKGPTQSVCVADCYFTVNVMDLPFASPIAIYR